MIYITATLAAVALAPIGSADTPRAYTAKAEYNGQLISLVVGPFQAEVLTAAIENGAGQKISLRVQRGVGTLSGSYDAELSVALADARRAAEAAAEEAKLKARDLHNARVECLYAAAAKRTAHTPAFTIEYKGDTLRQSSNRRAA